MWKLFEWISDGALDLHSEPTITKCTGGGFLSTFYASWSFQIFQKSFQIGRRRAKTQSRTLKPSFLSLSLSLKSCLRFVHTFRWSALALRSQVATIICYRRALKKFTLRFLPAGRRVLAAAFCALRRFTCALTKAAEANETYSHCYTCNHY